VIDCQKVKDASVVSYIKNLLLILGLRLRPKRAHWNYKSRCWLGNRFDQNW